MPPREAFPPQVVNLVIDELGDAYQNCHRNSIESVDPFEALCACTLVSRKWADRSRAHLFNTVEIHVPEGEAAPTPPPAILPHVKKLEVLYSEMSYSSYWPVQVPSIPDLLRAFSAAPIESLGIIGAELANQRVSIREFIDAHSATLQTVKFEGCLLSAYNISDVVLGRYRPKRLRLVDCACGQPQPPGKPPVVNTPNPSGGSKTAELELSISGGYEPEPLAQIVSAAAWIPYQLSRLEFDYVVANVEVTEAANDLIEVNAHALSSLRIRLWADSTAHYLEPGIPAYLLSLEDCSNLSELTLDMEHTESHIIHHSISVLSTLDPAQSSRLGKITLEVWCVSQLFNKDGPVEDEGSEVEEEFDEDDPINLEERGWEGLDTVLSKLAEASISMRDKRLAFTLVIMKQRGNERLLSTARKWLPEVLPRFNELGLLHVHYTRSGRCARLMTVVSATTNRAAWQRTSRMAVRLHSEFVIHSLCLIVHVVSIESRLSSSCL